MNPRNKDHNKDEPLHIHLGDDEDEHDDAGCMMMPRIMTTAK